MPQSRRTQYSTFWFALLILCAAGDLSAGFVCQPGVPGPPATQSLGSGANNSFTTSFTCSEQVTTTNLTQRVDQFTTELRARLQGGPLLLDQTFAAPFSDPVGQSALVSAQQLLTAQGAKGFLGPALLGNNTAPINSNTIPNVIQSAAPQTFVAVTSNIIGPGSVQIGTIGQCQGANAAGVPFGCDPAAGNPATVQAGTSNTNVNSHTSYFLSVTNTTTNTFLTSQVYELDGVSAPAAGVPEPGTLALAGIAIPGLWLGLRLRGRREMARKLDGG